MAQILVDIAGSSESDGLLLDEYTETETNDLVEVIEWLAEQPWSNGNVGMTGISWSGFNSLQVAARRPRALKAIIAACASDDRYADDVHYLGGCVLGWDAMLWGCWEHAFAVAPPDPTVVGHQWGAIWQQRLASVEPALATWLHHQHRDHFWEFNSVRDDVHEIECPVLMLGGWQDAYRDAVLRMVDALPGQAWGVVGPWGHTWPDDGAPGPALDFLNYELRWWRHWLLAQHEGIEEDPALTVFVQGSRRPGEQLTDRTGRWVSLPRYAQSEQPSRLLRGSEAEGSQDAAHWNPAQGHAAGFSCGYGFPSDDPIDQQTEDALSATWDWEVDEGIDILGIVRAHLTVSADAPSALVAVRLCDVAPDGSSTLITQGQLNLAHRDGHAQPNAVPVNESILVEVPMQGTAYHVPAGHRVRLAVTPSSWPFAWPSPSKVALEVNRDHLALELPLVGEGGVGMPAGMSAVRPVAAPDDTTGVGSDVVAAADDDARLSDWLRTVSFEFGTGRIVMQQANPLSRQDFDDGTWFSVVGDNRWSVGPDPTTAEQYSEVEFRRGGPGWETAWTVNAHTTCNVDNFLLHVRVTAAHGTDQFFDRTYDYTIPRNFQ